MMAQVANDSLEEYLFAVVPSFVPMGLLVTVSGVGRDRFDVVQHLLGRVRAGLGMPIPPSLSMIVHAVLAQQSVGRMVLAGIGPGLALSPAFCLTIALLATLRGPAVFERAERFDAKPIAMADTAVKSIPIRGSTLTTRANGHVEQNAPIPDLAIGIAEILAYGSTAITRCPGDIAVTGTPGGVGRYRKPQLVLEVEIDGIGTLRNGVIDGPPRSSAARRQPPTQTPKQTLRGGWAPGANRRGRLRRVNRPLFDTAMGFGHVYTVE